MPGRAPSEDMGDLSLPKSIQRANSSAPVPLNDVAHRLKPKVATEATKEYSKRPGNARSSFRVLTVVQPLPRGSIRIGTEHVLTANKTRRL